MMIKKRTWGAVALVFAGVIGVIGLAANTASADPYVISFDLQSAQFNFDRTTMRFTATTMETSSLVLNLVDPSAKQMLDRAKMIAMSPTEPFNFSMTLDLTRVGFENWTATGNVMWSDTNTGSNAVEAAFRSTNIVIKDGAQYTLNMDGLLSPLSGNTILVNRGDPWKFLGNASQTADLPNADGVDGQITVFNSQAYNGGDMFVIQTTVGTRSLDELFGSTWGGALEGEVKGSIVPAPAAVALGLMGLGLVGVWMRRYA